jgi:hypothetical protein
LIFAQNQVIGYFPYWAQYSQYKPTDVHFERVSELRYASLMPVSDGSIAWVDEMDAANFDTLSREAAKHRVPLVAVVGGMDAAEAFVTIAADESLRSTFAKALAEWVNRYDLAGVELDWQGLASDNTEKFSALLSEIKSALSGKSVGVAVYPASADAYGEALKSADFVTVFIGNQMSVDSATVRPNLSLSDVSGAMNLFVDKGVNKAKLSVVVSLSGMSFAGASGLGSSHQGAGSGNEGYLSYKDLMARFDTPDYMVSFDGASSSEVAVGNGETIVFSGIPSVKAISSWIKDNGFGGVALYDVSQDHPEAIVSLLVTAGQVLRPGVNYAPVKKK